MSKKKATETNDTLWATESPRPRIHKFTVQNFRCIKDPVTIDIDDIVILVGPNNVGKSSILRAYALIMSEGSNECILQEDDFPARKVDANALPQMELETVVFDNSPGDRWIREHSGEKFVRERWIWEGPGSKPKRQGFDVQAGSWSDEVPWGAPNVANTRRPRPHRVSAFDAPETAEKQIADLCMEAVKVRAKALQKGETTDNEHTTTYNELLASVRQLQEKLVNAHAEQIGIIEKELSSLVASIFPGYAVKFDANVEDDLDKAISLFRGTAGLRMGPQDGFQSRIENQGSGAQRTLIWSTLRMIASTNGAGGRPNVLLFDEPEICLQPELVRESCRTLYDLPKTKNWQVMVTTHSPAFVDFSRDNTTIVRVERIDGIIRGTTVFRPSSMQLSSDDKENLKLLNVCDPYVAEFFFGGHIIIVEGDTEFTAFKYVISQQAQHFRNIHIVRARGKATIALLAKIFNHFGSSYSVLHDSDKPTARREGKEITNPAWTSNNLISEAVAARQAGSKVRLLASVPNFEEAYLKIRIGTDKPYNVLSSLRSKPMLVETIKKLLESLVDYTKLPPEGCLDWTSGDLASLASAVESMSLET